MAAKKDSKLLIIESIKKCFVYLLWVYLCLKFPEMRVESDIMHKMRLKLRTHWITLLAQVDSWDLFFLVPEFAK